MRRDEDRLSNGPLMCAALCWLVCAGAVQGDTGFIETAKLLASDGAAGAFGNSVAVSGDRVVVGAHFDDDNGTSSGSAYVFDWDGSQWVETKLVASDGAAGDEFGNSVAVSGDRVVVGAFEDDDNGFSSGSAYVFDWDGTRWVETKLVRSDPAEGDVFGGTVAVSGDRVVVGAPWDRDNGNFSGSVYVFDWDGSQWVETKLLASDGTTQDEFGGSLGVSGDRVVVGAIRDDDNGNASGSVYVLERDGSQWVETKLLASDGRNGDHFGSSVAVSGDRVVVGADGDADHGNFTGSAYVFDWDGLQWVETKLVASDGAAGDLFGNSVAVMGDLVVVGAFDDDDNGSSSGSAYVFEWDGAKWAETKLVASDGAASDEFGLSVAVSGSRLVVGAPFDDPPSGSAYVVNAIGLGGSATGLTTNRVLCVNQETFDRVQALLIGSAWDCAGAGFVASPGDRILERGAGTASAAAVGGTAFGVIPSVVTCLNETTGQSVTIELAGETSWDCTAAGLEVTPGDGITLAVRGRAE